MAGNDLHIGIPFASEPLDCFSGHEHMRSSVEAITADGIFLIHLIRQRILERFLFHAHAPCGIKHRHLRRVGHCLAACVDSHQVCRIMQWSERDDFLDCGDTFIRNKRGRCEIRTAVQDAVTDRGDIFHVLDNADLLIRQYAEHQLDRLLMRGHRSFFGELFTVRGFIGQFAVDPDAFAKTLCQNRFRFDVNQLVF